MVLELNPPTWVRHCYSRTSSGLLGLKSIWVEFWSPNSGRLEGRGVGWEGGVGGGVRCILRLRRIYNNVPDSLKSEHIHICIYRYMLSSHHGTWGVWPHLCRRLLFGWGIWTPLEPPRVWVRQSFGDVNRNEHLT